MVETKFSTIAIKKDVLDELSALEVFYHDIKMDKHSDKIQALVKLYKQNYKSL